MTVNRIIPIRMFVSKNRLLSASLFFVILFVSACASTEPTGLSNPVSSASTGFDLFKVSSGALIITPYDLGQDARAEIGGDVSFSASSADGSRLVLAFSGEEKSALYGFESQSSTPILLHSGSAALNYSGTWNEAGTEFFFGYYVPEGKRMGAGGISKYLAADESVSSVGCSASRMVLGIAPDGSLLVRNSDNIYRVSMDGCDTLDTVDARKMYHVTVSPDGSHMAYILRELEFNRDTRQYEPDSMLYLQPTMGGEAKKIVGDNYNPRNMAWSVDGQNLAFDVILPADEGYRAISIYSIDLGSSGYMIAPDKITASQSHPVYSPDGIRVMFQSTDSEGMTTWMTKANLTPFPVPIAGSEDLKVASARWLDGDHLFVTLKSGEKMIVRGPEVVWRGDSSAVFARRVD